MKTFLAYSVCLILSGCYCNLSLSKNRLHSIKKFEYGFEISKITVDSFNVDGIPFRYSRDTIITCSPYCFDYASELEFKAINGDNAVFIDSCAFNASRTIYLNKENSDYIWWYFKPYYPNIDYKVLPLNFRRGCWYEIKNACPYYYIFFFVKENGKWEIIEVKDWY